MTIVLFSLFLILKKKVGKTAKIGVYQEKKIEDSFKIKGNYLFKK